MNVMTTTSRLAATGAAAALAAAALVGVTTTTANATPVTNSYSCSNASFGLGPWTVGLLSDAPGIEGFPQVPAGFDAPGGLLTLTNTFTIPDSAYNTLAGNGVEDVAFPDFAGSFGPNPVGVTGMTAKVSEMTDNGDGTHSFQSDGLNAAFEAPSAGTYDVLSPGGFTMSATVPGLGDVPVSCVLTEGTPAGAYANIMVVKNASTASGKPVDRTLKTTKVAKMKVTVAAGNEIPTGKVIVKEGTQKLGSAMLNDLGKATVAMGKLSKGKHKVKVIYKGDGYTLGDNSDPIVFTVVKP